MRGKTIAKQQTLIADLKTAGHLVVEAENALQTYISALRHLEDHARKMRAKSK